MVGVFSFRLGGAPFDSGLGGRLVTLLSDLGGCGKELMLTVLRSVLPPALMLDTARGWRRLEVEPCDAVPGKLVTDRLDTDGARKPLRGVFGVEVGMPPVLFRVFAKGRAGRAVVGGLFDGRELLGRAVVIMKVRELEACR